MISRKSDTIRIEFFKIQKRHQCAVLRDLKNVSMLQSTGCSSEELNSVPNTHNVVHIHVTHAPFHVIYLIHFSGLHGLQACKFCRDIHSDK